MRAFLIVTGLMCSSSLVLNNAVKAYSQLKDNKVKFSDVEPYLNTIGVHLAKSELDEITKSLNVSCEYLLSHILGQAYASPWVLWIEEEGRGSWITTHMPSSLAHFKRNVSSTPLPGEPVLFLHYRKAAHLSFI